ncbi:hypothetical protein ACFOON_05795 [Novosphingobium piscinae]|uniref:DUF4239 domain-containing protein n=1 Tax=Novosphingobium piscinae TaxID=1507448 RepID=A0A7X1KQD0_9SPHN|nr:hypothetical protein [Novosphingobium piscinae]MBC2669642.1 hypothetical protein [Novosphingobium piscinae]
MAGLDDFLGAAPLWLVGALLLAALVLAALAGRWVRLTYAADPRPESPDSYLLSTALALLGLLIAFTFSLAVARYDDRREAVIREGNAIGTAWLRAGLVAGSEGEALRDRLRGYADLRAALPTAPDRRAVEAASARAQTAVWAAVRAALVRLEPPLGATLVNAANEMFDAAAARKAEREARIPGRVLDVVSLYAVISAGIVGYVTARRGSLRPLLEAGVLFVLLTLALTLILDLDRPWSGAITISAAPVSEARAAMGT